MGVYCECTKFSGRGVRKVINANEPVSFYTTFNAKKCRLRTKVAPSFKGNPPNFSLISDYLILDINGTEFQGINVENCIL